MASPQERAERLAAELTAALDDPARYEWGEGPWEHLGDAERDVRVLLGELRRLEARVAALTQALEEFANPQHWGISREFRDPAFIWIGTYQKPPMEFAQEALDAALRVEQEETE